MKAEVIEVCRAVRAAGGRALLVGGSVRDFLLGSESKDYDLEVYGLEPGRLKEILQQIATVNTVGEHFAVYKLSFKSEVEATRPGSTAAEMVRGAINNSRTARFEIDVSIPRRESKSGRGHRGFAIEGDPSMSFEEALRRRDFTINAVMYDPLTTEMIDPFSGGADLNRRVLRAVAADTFGEDSLRVLRAVQLAARFELSIDPGTMELCRSIELADLPRERIWGEIEKLMVLSARPSIGLQAALDLGVLDKIFPEIRALVGCPQEPEWHPEGDVFTHTKLALDVGAQLITDLPNEKRITIMLAILCHDLGKPSTTSTLGGRLRSFGHDEAGIDPTLAVLERLGIYTLNGYDVRGQVIALVREHLRPAQLYGERDRLNASAFRRLACRVDMELLYRVAKADSLGRGPASSSHRQEWFIDQSRSLGLHHGPPSPLIQGRHLLAAGLEPGPRVGEILRAVYELQLDGHVTTEEEAVAAARRLL